MKATIEKVSSLLERVTRLESAAKRGIKLHEQPERGVNAELNSAIENAIYSACTPTPNFMTRSTVTVVQVHDLPQCKLTESEYMDKQSGVIIGMDVQKDGIKMELCTTQKQLVLDAWKSLKQQAENEIDKILAAGMADAYPEKASISNWIVDVYEDSVRFTRIENGSVRESYPPVPLGKASIYAAAIINGLQPPKGLRQCEKPFDQTQSECAQDPAI